MARTRAPMLVRLAGVLCLLQGAAGLFITLVIWAGSVVGRCMFGSCGQLSFLTILGSSFGSFIIAAVVGVSFLVAGVMLAISHRWRGVYPATLILLLVIAATDIVPSNPRGSEFFFVDRNLPSAVLFVVLPLAIASLLLSPPSLRAAMRQG